MGPILGTYRAGRVILDAPVDWPEGARVAVEAASSAEGSAEGDGPEARAERLARFDAIVPLELTPEDEAEIASARADVRWVSLDTERRRLGDSP